MSEGRNKSRRSGGGGGDSDGSDVNGQTMKGRASMAGNVSEFAKALELLRSVWTVFKSQEDVEVIEEIGLNRQSACASLATSKADLGAATQRLESALRDAEARVKMLSDGSVAESELEALSKQCETLASQARACDEAVERAKEEWHALEDECRMTEDTEINADVARDRKLPEICSIVTLLLAATNALFERDGTVCRLLLLTLHDVDIL